MISQVGDKGQGKAEEVFPISNHDVYMKSRKNNELVD